jgi:hypothetical protein
MEGRSVNGKQGIGGRDHMGRTCEQDQFFYICALQAEVGMTIVDEGLGLVAMPGHRWRWN